jgi:hypothetical protein
LRKILLSRARRARDLARRWDPEVIEDALEVEKGFPAAVLDASGKLDVTAWRMFMDEGFRPAISRLITRHADRRSEGYSKYRGAESLLGTVLKRIVQVSKIESLLVYQAWGIPEDPRDLYRDEEQPSGDEPAILQILQKDLALLQAYRSLPGAVEDRAPAAPEGKKGDARPEEKAKGSDGPPPAAPGDHSSR